VLLPLLGVATPATSITIPTAAAARAAAAAAAAGAAAAAAAAPLLRAAMMEVEQRLQIELQLASR
jgi:hypothetical protein